MEVTKMTKKKTRRLTKGHCIEVKVSRKQNELDQTTTWVDNLKRQVNKRRR